MIDPIILSLIYLKLRYIFETPEEEIRIPLLNNTDSYLILRECVKAGIYDKEIYKQLGIKNIIVATFLPELRKEFPKEKKQRIAWSEKRANARALLIASIERDFAANDTTKPIEIMEAKQSVHEYFYHRGDYKKGNE